MPADDFQIILKDRLQQSLKKHQEMGIVLLAIIQNCVPKNAFWAFSGQARPQATSKLANGDRLPRQSCKSSSKRQRKVLKITECMPVYKTLAAGETEQVKSEALKLASSLWVWTAGVHCHYEQLPCGMSCLKPLLTQHIAAHPLRSTQEHPPSQPSASIAFPGLFLSTLYDN